MCRAHPWLPPGKSYRAACQLRAPRRSWLLLDVMPTVFQTLCQALGGIEVLLEEPALHLGSPGGASNKSDRNWKGEVRADQAFKSSQNDGGQGVRGR